MTDQAIQTTTPATSSAPQCCKCERPAALSFVWPWGATGYCCELDKQAVVNNVAALSSGKVLPKFVELDPKQPDTVRPPAFVPPHETQPTGAAVVATSTPASAIPDGTLALVSLAATQGQTRFLLRRPGQGDIEGKAGELAIVLSTLGLIPPLPSATPSLVGQHGQATPAAAVHALAGAGAVHRPPTAPALAPHPPIRPPVTHNPFSQAAPPRVAGRYPGQVPPGSTPQLPPNTPAPAPGGLPVHFDAELQGTELAAQANASPPPAPASPPVQSTPSGGEPTSEGTPKPP